MWNSLPMVGSDDPFAETLQGIDLFPDLFESRILWQLAEDL